METYPAPFPLSEIVEFIDVFAYMIYPMCIEVDNVYYSWVSADYYIKSFFDCSPPAADERFDINYNFDSHSIDGWGKQMVDAWNDGDAVEAGLLYGTMVRELTASPCYAPYSTEVTIDELKALKEKDMKAKELLFS